MLPFESPFTKEAGRHARHPGSPQTVGGFRHALVRALVRSRESRPIASLATMPDRSWSRAGSGTCSIVRLRCFAGCGRDRDLP
jgi:hypothetical protein